MAAADPSPTPNPNAMKFTLDVTLTEMLDVRSVEAAAGNPLAERIFAIPGVVMLFEHGGLHHRQPRGGRRLGRHRARRAGGGRR